MSILCNNEAAVNSVISQAHLTSACSSLHSWLPLFKKIIIKLRIKGAVSHRLQTRSLSSLKSQLEQRHSLTLLRLLLLLEKQTNE